MRAWLRRLDERVLGPAVPRPPTMEFRRWPIFDYPDPWWAVPVLYVWIGLGLLAMRYSWWGGVTVISALLIVSAVMSTRAARKLRHAWKDEWDRLRAEPSEPVNALAQPTVRTPMRTAIVVLALIALGAFYLARG